MVDTTRKHIYGAVLSLLPLADIRLSCYKIHTEITEDRTQFPESLIRTKRAKLEQNMDHKPHQHGTYESGRNSPDQLIWHNKVVLNTRNLQRFGPAVSRLCHTNISDLFLSMPGQNDGQRISTVSTYVEVDRPGCQECNQSLTYKFMH